MNMKEHTTGIGCPVLGKCVRSTFPAIFLYLDPIIERASANGLSYRYSATDASRRKSALQKCAKNKVPHPSDVFPCPSKMIERSQSVPIYDSSFHGYCIAATR
jgi:hypothetical protein